MNNGHWTSADSCLRYLLKVEMVTIKQRLFVLRKRKKQSKSSDKLFLWSKAKENFYFITIKPNILGQSIFRYKPIFFTFFCFKA